MRKNCIIAFVGKPNVGKSSLFNCFFNQKYSIVSLKPQTTRYNIKSVYRLENEIIGMIDTPGIHRSLNLLDHFIDRQIKAGIKETDIIVGLFDASVSLNENDEAIIRLINKNENKKIIVCLTKKDLVTAEKLNRLTDQILQKLTNKKIPVIGVSIKEPETKEKILAEIRKILLTMDYANVPEAWENSNNDSMLLCETIRETCLELLKDEIPYGIDVEITEKKYNAKNNTFLADLNIVVEKESHKKILIGKTGNMIKKIGTISRKKLLQIYDCKIYLNLFVKTKKDWRNNPTYLSSRGYK